MPAGALADGDREPDITRAPALAGTAQVGQRLSADGATWTGRSPLTVTYAWLRCDSESLWSCKLLDAPREPSYPVGAGDLGKRLRAVVVVSNRHGTDYAWSEPSAAVAAAPLAPPPPPAPPPADTTTPPAASPPPADTTTPPAASPPPLVAPTPVTDVRLRMMRPAPRVRIRGWLTRRGAMITRLSVRAPRGVTISVRCIGRGCPRRSLARAARVTRLKAFERRLRAGTRLVIRVTRPGFIGKHTTIRIRRGKAPARRDRCLLAGSRRPAKCPGA